MPGVDTLGLSNGSNLPDTTGSPYEADATSDRLAMAQAHQQNVALGLLAAGLATAAGRRRDPLANLAEGGLFGLNVYGQGEYRAGQGELGRQRERETERYHQDELETRREATQGQQALRAQAQAASQQQNRFMDQSRLQAQADRDQQNKAMNQMRGDDISARMQSLGIERANLSLNTEKTGAELAKDQADIDKQLTELKGQKPIGRDWLEKYRNSKMAGVLPSPEDAAAMPIDLVNKNGPSMLKAWAGTAKELGSGTTPKDMSSTIDNLKKTLPTGYGLSRVEPDDTVVFENSGITGNLLSGPVKMKVPGAYETMGPNGAGASSGGPSAPASAVPNIPTGAKPVYGSDGNLLGYTHD